MVQLQEVAALCKRYKVTNLLGFRVWVPERCMRA